MLFTIGSVYLIKFNHTKAFLKICHNMIKIPLLQYLTHMYVLSNEILLFYTDLY